MADEWTHGPTRHLKEGLARYLATYRVRLGSGWRLYRIERTMKVEQFAERKFAAEIHARLEARGKRFEILDVRNVGTEVPLDGGNVVTEKEWIEEELKIRAQWTEKEFNERAKELGLFIPKPGKIIH